MKLTSIDTLTLADVDATGMIDNKSRPIDFDVRRRQRSDASAFVGAGARPTEWRAVINWTTQATRDAVLAALDGDPDAERRWGATRDGVPVVGYAAVRRIELNTEGVAVVVTLDATHAEWVAETATLTEKTFSSALDRAMLVTVPGNQRVSPVIRLKPTVQRTGVTAAVGWRWRRRFTLTNGGTRGLYRYAYRLALGDMAAKVTAAKALSSGNDLRVWIGGREVKRSLVTFNTTAAFVWFLIPALAAGKSTTVEVVYGNASAASPPVLAGDDLPIFNLTSSTNILWVYTVDKISDNDRKGGYHVSPTGSPPTVHYDRPGSWRPVMTFGNPENGDDCNQARYTLYVASGNRYIGNFNASRYVAGGADLSDEGLADGLTIDHPLGISSVRADILYENDEIAGAGSAAVGKFVILTRNSGAEVWETLFTDESTNGTQTTIATATYTPAAAVTHLAMAVWPKNDVEVDPRALSLRKVQAQWKSILELNLDSAALTVAEGGSETEVYELATNIRLGGGSGVAVPPFASLTVGNAAAETGEGSPHAAVAINQQAVIDCERRSHWVWDSALTAPVEQLPVATVQAVSGRSDDGVTTRYPASEWLPMQPGPEPLPNPSFDTDLTGWERGTVHASVTVNAQFRDTTIFDTSPASLQTNITASTAGAGALVEDIASAYLPILGRAAVGFGASVRTSDVDVLPALTIWFHDAAQLLLGVANLAANYVPPLNTFHRRAHAAAVPAGAAYWRVGVTAKGLSANQIAVVRMDSFDVVGHDLDLSDPGTPGTVEVDVLIDGRWLP